MNHIKDKKILFLGIGFYDYEDAILKYFYRTGALSCYYNVSPINIITKILTRSPFSKKVDSLYGKLLMRFLCKTKMQFDYVFIIKGAYITETHMDFLRKSQKNAWFILYLWDSIERINGINLIIKFFDRILSFDTEDVKKYGFIFRPLFFRPEIKNNSGAEKIYDISFVGWAHSDRINILKNIGKNLSNEGCTTAFFVFIGKIKKILWILLGKTEKNSILTFITKPLDFNTYCDIMIKSKSVFDIHHPSQSGLTMRSIEAFAAGCYLFTTNPYITEYTDIPHSNYRVMDRTNPSISSIDIINIPKRMNMVNIENYSLERFMEDIFSVCL